ncbi:MAG TPA: AAA family ATPase [Candidatus Tectomicrobia bacterium]|jgi:DNA-binding winged helix-turn-helix (wHTH) protein/predicted ATPase
MQWHFGSFRLDLANACLWRAEQPVTLRPKTFEILVYLVTHAGQLVTKETLFDTIWPGTVVSDGVLKTSVNELRKALGETAKAPQWIATVHRRGYRFVAPVTLVESAPPPAVLPAPTVPLPAPIPALALPPAPIPVPTPAPRLVAREAEVVTLHQWFANALRGEHHLGFITGEAGIGKTMLVDTFVAQLAGQTPLWIGRGQCIEQYGAGEAYLPLLEALGQMGHTPDGPQLVALLRQQAPSWLLQLPALLAPAEYEALQRYAGGTTRERMLRELAEAMEALTAVRPCVLVMEDLHWSDTGTIEWLAYMARRRGPVRLLVLGTYRPVEAIVRQHPVRAMVQELMVHDYGTELALEEWSEAGVATYLAQRGAGAEVPAALARMLTQRTDGHPLFVVALVDELLRQRVLQVGPAGWVLTGGLDPGTVGVPLSIRHLLEHQVARLRPADQELLAAASVAGVEFAVAAVAAGVQQTGEEVEARCDALARQHQLVQARGTAVWPDGTVTARYGFRHALYQELIYERVPVSRRMRWHQQIGTRLEAAFGPRADEVAAELAVHFEQGHDYYRAVQYLQRTAATAVQRHAHREAIAYLRRALELLQAMAEMPQRFRYELSVRLALGPSLMVTRGFAAPEVADTYARARQLCEQLGEQQQLFPALFGLWRSAHVRGQLQTARALGEQLLSLAHAQDDPLLCVEAQGPLGQTLCMQGEPGQALEHLQRVVALYEPHWQRPLVVRCGYDPGVYAHVMEAWVLWALGYPAQGRQRSQAALCLAREQVHPFTLSLTLVTIVILQHMRREGEATLEHVQASLVLSTEYDFPYLTALGIVLQGWELTRRAQVAAGITQMRQGLAALRTMGAEVLRPFLLALLADACAWDGQIKVGLGVLNKALMTAEQHTERFYTAELHRLKGELILRYVADARTTCQSLLQTEAEACFQNALHLAQRQTAKLLELRAAMSLARLWQQQDKRTAARELLAPIYGWFTEGFDTADLQECKGLLDTLG